MEHAFALSAGLITVDNEAAARRVAAHAIPDFSRTEALLLRCVAHERGIPVEPLLAQFALTSAEQISRSRVSQLR